MTINNALAWPAVLERERALSWIPDFGNQSSPPGLDGTRQYRNTNGGGLWRCSFRGVQLRNREHILEWFAMEVKLRGGLIPIDVPCCSYRPSAITGSLASIKTVGAWAARAISGRLDLVNSTEIEAGMSFSKFDTVTYGRRLYRLESVSAVSGSGTQRDVVFWPPLRFAIADDDTLNFNTPRCVMRLASSDSMDVELDLHRRGNPNAEFVEAY